MFRIKIHRMFNNTNVTTMHFGSWPFNQKPDTTYSFITDDPIQTIDNLFNTGLFFTNHYSSSSVCSPTRASLMTGRYPFHKDVGIHLAYVYNFERTFDMPKCLGYDKKMTYITSFFNDNGWRQHILVNGI